MNTNIINPKPCDYNCGTRIYWNTLENAYFEIFSGNRHQCPNRQRGKKSNSVLQTTTNTTTKPNYYKKSYYATQQQPKPKMNNSLELLQGSITDVQQRYEILSDIVSEANGKVHGSQSHIISANTISLIVYFEVPEGKREEVKQRFNDFIRNKVKIYHLPQQ